VSNLVIAWGICLIVALGAFPQAVVRTIAYRSGEVDHTRTMRIAATVAVATCAAGSVGFAITSALLVARS
jgi:O-antigen/teichoic acid export membrane protein